MIRATARSVILLLCGVFLAGCVPFSWLDWGGVRDPYPGEPYALGLYSSGCLSGGEALPWTGTGYQTMRISRNRYYGHPSLIEYIRRLALKVSRQTGGMLLIGDLAQPRGGPMKSGHRSHQNGLDADIWFWHPEEAKHASLTMEYRESTGAKSLVSRNGKSVDHKIWQPYYRDILKLAASAPEVERIFVNYTIKKKLCESNRGETWLQKIRPWWDHDHHFHVRLKCPAGEPLCASQDILAQDDGCGKELAWWFSPEAHRKDSKSRALTATAVRADVDLPPKQCKKIFTGN